jgi:hypothetical protein
MKIFCALLYILLCFGYLLSQMGFAKVTSAAAVRVNETVVQADGQSTTHSLEKRSIFGLINFLLLFVNALLAINLNVNIPDNVGEIGR